MTYAGIQSMKLAHDVLWDEENGDDPTAIRKTADIRSEERGADFESFLLKESVLKGLKRTGYLRPSPIQLKAIPFGRCGLDLVVQAKSGTGKTCVFTVLALETVEATNSATQVLIIAPTREIASQIHMTLIAVGDYMIEKKENVFTGLKAQAGINIECFIGGTTLRVDQEKLKLQKCQILVGTPGRIMQLINERHLSLDAVRLFVLDEADKLMQESYVNDINSIYAYLPTVKQMIVTSATYPRQLDEFLSRYMKTPKMVNLDKSDVQLLGVKQYILMADFDRQRGVDDERVGEFDSWLDKKINVLHQLFSRILFNQCMIFCNFQDKVEEVHKRLMLTYKWPTASISSNLTQKQRNTVLLKLKNCQIRILVATDLMARGIDAEKVNLVINFDIPSDAETYFHRIGRAGRFGGYGAAVTLVMNKAEKLKFYTLAVENSFQAKKLPGISKFPSNLVENEQFFLDLPNLDLPSIQVLKRDAEKYFSYKSKNQQADDQNVPKTVEIKTGLDDYSKLIQLAGPVERWSPTEFVWDGIRSEFRNTPLKHNTQVGYSRDEMLSILRESLLSSLPPSRCSQEPVQPDPVVDNEQALDASVKGKRIDVGALFSYFQDTKENTSYFPTDMSKEDIDVDRRYAEDFMSINVEPKATDVPSAGTADTDKDLTKSLPEVKKYSKEEFLAVRPLCGRAYAEKIFNFPALLETFEKKKKTKKTGDDKKTRKYSRDDTKTVEPIDVPAVQQSAAINIPMDEKQQPVSETKKTIQTPKIKIQSAEKENVAKVGIQKVYDEAIQQAVQSPFYRFFGDCALQLQARAVEARRGPNMLDKEVQTENMVNEYAQFLGRHIAPEEHIPYVKKLIIAYDRDQMLAVWKTVANPEWSRRSRQYPWAKIVEENDLLVDRYVDDLVQDSQRQTMEEENPQRQTVEEGVVEIENLENGDSDGIKSGYQSILQAYGELLNDYKKVMAEGRSRRLSSSLDHFWNRYSDYQAYVSTMINAKATAENGVTQGDKKVNGE